MAVTPAEAKAARLAPTSPSEREPAKPRARGADLRVAVPPRSRSLRPTRAVIDLEALVHNLGEVRRSAGSTAVLAVIKANAYGHGAVLCGRGLEKAGVEMLGVALVEEGLELRDAGVRAPVLVLGGASEGAESEIVQAGLTPLVYRPDQVLALEAAARSQGRTVPLHLKLDTGMGRIGARLEDLGELIESLRGAASLQVEGVLSHFANADQADQAMNQLQVGRFGAALAALGAAGIQPKWRHLSNSAGVLGLPGAHDGALCNLVRPGLMLYGESPAERLREAARLRPVLSWVTQIVHLKRVPAGTPISYGGRWSAIRDSVIATLPVGYADGYSRKLTNTGEVLVRGERAHVAGTVCMDMTMVDVTSIASAARGDEVVLLGTHGAESVSAQELAAKVGTIPYEIFCDIAVRVPRVEKGA